MNATEREKRRPTYITCRCGTQWTALNAAHCAADGCHQTFIGPTAFDLHRSMTGEHGTCRRPADITNAMGERMLFHRNRVWRGPEMSDDEKTKRFTAKGG